LKEELTRRVGNGDEINIFFYDKWIPQEVFSTPYIHGRGLSEDAVVADLIDRDTHSGILPYLQRRLKRILPQKLVRFP
jgi:hypothetical protein